MDDLKSSVSDSRPTTLVRVEVLMSLGRAMATWTQIKQFLYQNYTVQSDDGEMMTLVIGVMDNRTQLVTVMLGESSILINSPVASIGEVTAERMLAATEGCLLGVKRLAGMYMVSAVAPIGDMDEEELNTPLLYAALTADGIEQTLGIGDKY